MFGLNHNQLFLKPLEPRIGLSKIIIFYKTADLCGGIYSRLNQKELPECETI